MLNEDSSEVVPKLVVVVVQRFPLGAVAAAADLSEQFTQQRIRIYTFIY